jgi:hypothetical protein
MVNWKYEDLLKWIDDGCCENIANTITSLSICGIFNGKKISVVPPEIGQLINLESFNCSNNELTQLPKCMSRLVNLTRFKCYNNKITHLPNDMGNLINLTSIWCYSNKITHLPNNIGNLVNLDYFDCRNNNLVVIPKEIENLINLEIFDCSKNKLKYLPTFRKLNKLQYFDCHDNQLTCIINLPCENKLQYYDCHFNNIINESFWGWGCHFENLDVFCCDEEFAHNIKLNNKLNLQHAKVIVVKNENNENFFHSSDNYKNPFMYFGHALIERTINDEHFTTYHKIHMELNLMKCKYNTNIVYIDNVFIYTHKDIIDNILCMEPTEINVNSIHIENIEKIFDNIQTHVDKYNYMMNSDHKNDMLNKEREINMLNKENELLQLKLQLAEQNAKK